MNRRNPQIERRALADGQLVKIGTASKVYQSQKRQKLGANSSNLEGNGPSTINVAEKAY